MTEQETILAALRDRDSITLMEAAALMPEGIRATTHVILRRMEQEFPENLPAPGEESLSFAEYMWTDGNYGCDCNRSILSGFKGETTCSEGLFSVRLRDETGSIFYDEFE